ncbi:MAG TPA: MerR family transcriptional regulator, partial [Geobacteraceae bacterium]
STLLYYDRIGLLSPSGRSDAHYRLYSPKDRERLETICAYRQAGLTIEDIAALLVREGDDTSTVLEHRLKALGEEIRALQTKQRLLARMLRITATGGPEADVDKETWVAMLRAAGMDKEAMQRWHSEFERRAPEAHHRFLISLGIDEKEAQLIRSLSAQGPFAWQTPEKSGKSA